MTGHPSLSRIRFAVLTFFLAQGLCFSSWASRIPDIKEQYEVEYALLWGLALFLIPVGKFMAIPMAGYLVSRFGSRIMAQVSVLGYGTALFAIGLSTHIYMLGVALFLFGVCWNLCDISLNTQGIGIERLFGRTIMASFHGAWSLAATAGALTGFLMIVYGISPFQHFSVIAILILLIVLSGRKYLQEDVNEEKATEANEENVAGKINWLKPEKLLIHLGLVGLCALVVESAMFDWSGIYFESVIHAPKTFQIGFLIFMVMMTVGRFLTNASYRLFGKRKVLQIAGGLIFCGFMISALPGNMVTEMSWKIAINAFGFMCVGLGISCMVPTIYSFVGAKSKTPVGLALTILSGISFIGSLIAPLLIGAVTQFFSITLAYLIVGFLGLVIYIMVTYSDAFRLPEEE